MSSARSTVAEFSVAVHFIAKTLCPFNVSLVTLTDFVLVGNRSVVSGPIVPPAMMFLNCVDPCLTTIHLLPTAFAPFVESPTIFSSPVALPET